MKYRQDSGCLLQDPIPHQRAAASGGISLRVPLIAVIALCLSWVLSGPGLASPISPVGEWMSIDDDGETPVSIIRIYESGDTLAARVVKIIKEGADPKALCTACQGELKDKPIAGMRILWGMQADGEEWSGGQILDPDSGESYSCILKLDGEKLIVRGYIGIKAFGRSQTWRRAPNPDPQASPETKPRS